MDKATKLQLVTQLIERGRGLTGAGHVFDSAFIKWKADATTFLRRAGVRCATDFERVTYEVRIATSFLPAIQRAFDRGMEHGLALLESAHAEIRDYDADPLQPSTPSALDEVILTCRRFPSAARRLQKRHASRGGIDQKDEYDVQGRSARPPTRALQRRSA